MSTLDQLQTILSCDNDERISISADETDIPRDILLQSKYSHQSGVIKKTKNLNFEPYNAVPHLLPSESAYHSPHIPDFRTCNCTTFNII